MFKRVTHQNTNNIDIYYKITTVKPCFNSGKLDSHLPHVDNFVENISKNIPEKHFFLQMLFFKK